MRGLVDLCSVKKENIVEYEVVPIPHSFGMAGCLRARMMGGELASPGGLCAVACRTTPLSPLPLPLQCANERARACACACARACA
jgi:hypothetical protein